MLLNILQFIGQHPNTKDYLAQGTDSAIVEKLCPMLFLDSKLPFIIPNICPLAYVLDLLECLPGHHT